MSTVAEGLTLLSWHGWAGIGGIVLYVVTYGMLQLGYLRSDTFTFCLLNALGGVCVLISLSQAFNLYSAVIQVIWIALSLAGLVRLIRQRRAIFFTPHEQSYIDQAMSGLSRHDARKLLDEATIMSINEGTVLTTEGEEITHLAYLLEGEARVFIRDKEIANLEPGTYIGDVTYESPQPATATVVLSSPAWAICFEIDKLRSFLQKNPRIRGQLSASTNRSVRSKLKSSNQRAGNTGRTTKPTPADPAAPDDVRPPVVEAAAAVH